MVATDSCKRLELNSDDRGIETEIEIQKHIKKGSLI